MLNTNTLYEVRTNVNPGVEYEIALFYKLLFNHPQEAAQVMSAIKARSDANKVMDIIGMSDERIILRKLREKSLSLEDVSFETQNDEVGPADLILFTKSVDGTSRKIGLSVKYANTCTLNVTGRNFITDAQIADLRKQLPEFTKMYIEEMSGLYGDVHNWFRQRKPSKTTDAFIDKIRDAVIANWPNVKNKSSLLSALFHSDSPIEFWVVTYDKKGFTVKTTPQTIEERRAKDVTVSKMETSYVAFYLDGRRVGHMQVKFNNGFVERCKKSTPDFVCQGVAMAYGQPFSSWNFSTEK